MIATYSRPGGRVNPLRLTPTDIRIEDIAHALSLTNRFCGMTRFPISVAQHSAWASWICAPPDALQALLHDASEAYLHDVSKWVKQTPEFAGYRVAEARAQHVIYDAFGLPHEDAPSVEYADRVLVRWEGEQGFGHGWRVESDPGVPHADYPPLTADERASLDDWEPWAWHIAERQFLRRFAELTTGQRARVPA